MSKHRQKYETETDRKNERVVADKIEKAWNCTAKKNIGEFPRTDYALLDKAGRACAVMEVKCRSHARARYPTIFISKAKVDSLEALAEKWGVTGFLVFQMKDGLFYLKTGDDLKPNYTEMGGRTDRGDRQDIEMMNHYNTPRMVGVDGFSPPRIDTSDLWPCQGGPEVA